MNKELRPHPDHEWLLLMSDGELAPEAHATMRKHLEACWECRHELQQIEGAIGDAVCYRKEVLAKYLPLPPDGWRDLSPGFAQIDREMAAPGVLSRIGAALRMPRYGIPLAAAVLGAAVGTMVLVDRSAEEGVQERAAVGSAVERGSSPSSPITQAAPEARTAPVAAVEPMPEPASTATTAELAHSAVLVVQLLHKLGADLGEPIEVSRTDQRVVVRGVGLDEARARELEPLLKQIPLVEFQLSSTGGGEATTVGRFTGPAGDAPFQTQLERELGGRNGVDAMASESLDRADAMMMRAHALRRLAGQFSNESKDLLSTDDQRALQGIRHELAAGMVTEIARLERTLTPALRALGAAAGPSAGKATADLASEATVFAAARRLESAIAELTGAKGTNGPVEQLPNRLASDLATASQSAKALAAGN